MGVVLDLSALVSAKSRWGGATHVAESIRDRLEALAACRCRLQEHLTGRDRCWVRNVEHGDRLEECDHLVEGRELGTA